MSPRPRKPGPKDVQLIRQYWSDERQLRRDLAQSFSREEQQLVEREAALVLAQQGKLLPGWEYPDQGPGRSAAERLPYQVRYDVHGLYGGEWAQLFYELMLNKLDRQILAAAAMIEPVVKNAICTSYDYCGRRKRQEFQSEGWNISVAICEAFVAAKLAFPFPFVALSVYLVKKGFLDRWCECS